MKKIWIYPVIFSAICGFLSPLAGPEICNSLKHMLPGLLFCLFFALYNPKYFKLLIGVSIVSAAFLAPLRAYYIADSYTVIFQQIQFVLVSLTIANLSNGTPKEIIKFDFATVIVSFAIGANLVLWQISRNIYRVFEQIPSSSLVGYDVVFAQGKLLAGIAFGGTLVALPVVFIACFILQNRNQKRAQLCMAAALTWLFVLLMMTVMPLVVPLFMHVNPFSTTIDQLAIIRHSYRLCSAGVAIPMTMLAGVIALVRISRHTIANYGYCTHENCSIHKTAPLEQAA